MILTAPCVGFWGGTIFVLYFSFSSLRGIDANILLARRTSRRLMNANYTNSYTKTFRIFIGIISKFVYWYRYSFYFFFFGFFSFAFFFSFLSAEALAKEDDASSFTFPDFCKFAAFPSKIILKCFINISQAW